MQFELLPPVPAVVVARELRRNQLFSFASVDELFRFSALARQVRHAEGATLQKAASPAEYIQVLVEGKVVASDPDGRERDLTPPALIGFREVLEGLPLRETIHARENSICLALRAEDFRALMSDNIELAEGLFRMLVEPTPEGMPPAVRKGLFRPGLVPAEPGHAMRVTDRALLLQELPLFSRASADDLLALASITREVPIESGKAAFGESEAASLWLVLSGALRVAPVHGGDSVQVDPGDALGIDEMLAGRSWGWRGQVERDGRALRMAREDLFGLLADRIDLLQGVFGVVLTSDRARNEGPR